MPVSNQPGKDSFPASGLPVMEHFYTIQGEGINTGKAAYFIRLAGCDVGCVWCDVKDSWRAENYPLMKIGEMIDVIKQHNSAMTVITGGEPMMYNLDELCTNLSEQNIYSCLETSGAYPLSGRWDWICVSPKKFKAPLPQVLLKANELKVIVYNTSDFKWAEEHEANVSSECKLLLQPEYSRFNEMIPLIVNYVKQHPQWQISLQTHKIINVP
jgi:7-carboxy-7-deazaguanine synthase